MEEFNVTGPLNSFVEQIQAARSQEIQNNAGVQPVVQMPQATQGRGSVIYYSSADTPVNGGAQGIPIVSQSNNVPLPQHQQPPLSAPPLIQPQPVIIGPQNRPTLDPALQQLLNSFNTNPAEAQRNTFVQGGQPMMQADLNTPIVSYITCYVGCSHVTNIVTNSATPMATWSVFLFAFSTVLIILF